MKEELGDCRTTNDIRAMLKSADPVRSEGPLSAADVERMRHTVLNAGHAAPNTVWFWSRALAAAALVLIIVIAGTFANRSTNTVEPADATKVRVPEEPAERRQLQFETPGGTRIIWTIDPEFKLQGVAP
jgi:hypothetical protein